MILILENFGRNKSEMLENAVLDFKGKTAFSKLSFLYSSLFDVAFLRFLRGGKFQTILDNMSVIPIYFHKTFHLSF